MQAFNQRLWGFYTSSRKHFTFATEKFTEGNWSWNQEASHCWRHWFLTQTLRWGCSNALRVSLTSVWRDQWWSMNQWLQRYVLVQWNQIQRTSLVLRSTSLNITAEPIWTPSDPDSCSTNFHSTITKLLLAFGAKKFCQGAGVGKKHLQNTLQRRFDGLNLWNWGHPKPNHH